MLLGLTGAAVGSGMQYRNFVWYAYFINTPQQLLTKSRIKFRSGLCLQVILWGCSREVCYIQIGFLPIAIYLVGKLLGTLRFVSGQYILFRLTADLERLPYPMAPIAAQGQPHSQKRQAKKRHGDGESSLSALWQV